MQKWGVVVVVMMVGVLCGPAAGPSLQAAFPYSLATILGPLVPPSALTDTFILLQGSFHISASAHLGNKDCSCYYSLPQNRCLKETQGTGGSNWACLKQREDIVRVACSVQGALNKGNFMPAIILLKSVIKQNLRVT